jgi:hypothetical protein
MDDINRQLLAAANGLPGAALGGRALVSYVEYLQGVSNRLGALLNHANLLTQTASRAVSEIESADNTLRQRAPALP